MKEYFERGFTEGLPLLSPGELSHYKTKALEWDEKLNLMKSDYRCKSNVLFKWAHDLSTHPKLLEYVENIIGPNFDCWDIMFWFKTPGDQKGISPHQDGIYWNWKPRHGVSAWIALTPVTVEDNAPVVFYEGSHRNGLQPHDDKPAPGNLLMRNQTVRHMSGDQYELEMQPGTVTLIHPHAIHGGPGSHPIGDKVNRMGIEIIYIANDAVPILHHGVETAVRMRGLSNPNIAYDPAPSEDFGEHEQKVWRAAYDNQHANYYKMTNTAAGVA